ncbi:hypothetical protein [Proteus penneri]|uniref:hypothetical protein n=1 Tax=Proteus penneri TaxID=102862 RepID=UPI0034D4EA5B
MAEKTPVQLGLGTGTTATTALIASLSKVADFLPIEYQSSVKELVPYISPLISWMAIWLYNRFAVPPEMAGIEGKLKRDLRYYKKNMRNKNLSAKERVHFRKGYSETLKKISSLGVDYSNGVYSKIP